MRSRLIRSAGLVGGLALCSSLLLASCSRDRQDFAASVVQRARSTSDAGILVLPDASLDTAGPMLMIVAPSEPGVAQNPGGYFSDDIVTADPLRVRCLALPNPQSANPVASDSVQITVTDGIQQVAAQAVPSGLVNEYEAELFLGDLKNGAISIWCSASEQSAAAIESSTFILSYLDLGPELEFVTPAQGSTHVGFVDIVFRLRGAPSAPAEIVFDPEPQDLLLQVNGQEFFGPIDGPDDQNLYRVTIYFDDTVGPPLSGEIEFSVSASNNRFPEPPVRSRAVTIVAQ